MRLLGMSEPFDHPEFLFEILAAARTRNRARHQSAKRSSRR
jgi:hypothetical protein